jgi:hypothetical protein
MEPVAEGQLFPMISEAWTLSQTLQGDNDPRREVVPPSAFNSCQSWFRLKCDWWKWFTWLKTWWTNNFEWTRN